MLHEIYFDYNTGSIRMNFKGLFTPQDAEEFFPLTKKLCEGKKRCYLLCDFKEGGTEIPKDKEYRQWLIKMYKESGFDRIAIFNTSPSMRMLAKIALAAAGQSKNVRFFKTEEEALSWFQNE
ncbi:STAS/SEC14 domain-containing protein [bacterium]|nr:STAS/SEC14 domain-containing protein [bacterium]